MRFRLEMGWSDEEVWRRQPAHQVIGWGRFRATVSQGKALK